MVNQGCSLRSKAPASPPAPGPRKRLTLSARHCLARFDTQVNLIEEQVMRGIVKLLIALGIGAALSGCVVAPVGPPRGYVAAGVVAPAPVVVVQGGYYWHRW
jgi:hypothetical protein